MRTTVNISEELAGNAKTVARLLGYSRRILVRSLSHTPTGRSEAMANDPDHLIRELGDLVWEDRKRARSGQRVIEHAAALTPVSRCRMPKGVDHCPVRG
jgi:hypothetical protein